MLDFAVNVLVPEPPEWLRAALAARLADLATYPDPALAADAAARHHGVGPERVLLTNGAAEAFTLIARARSWRRPVVVHPQFTEPEAALEAAGHEVTRVILGADRGFRVDASLVPENADLVVIGNPTNPTSVLHPRASLDALRRPGRVLVVDEAFLDVTSHPDDASMVATAAGSDDVAVVRSLTKSFGLAGLRAGYLLAGPGFVLDCAAGQPPWSVSALAARAVEECLTAIGQRHVAGLRAALPRRRTHLVEVLTTAGFVVAGPAAGPFVLARHPQAATVRVMLRHLGIAVRRGDTFPGLDETYLRFAVRDEEAVDSLSTALGAVRTRLRPAGVARDEPQPPMMNSREGAPVTSPSAGLGTTIAAIHPVDTDAVAAARARQETLTKPSGSMGALEELGNRLCGIYGACPPPLPEPVAIAVFAGDHGVHAQGVSPWPQEVTVQMVANITGGGAVINALARQVGASVTVVDVGVAAELPARDGFVDRKVAAGTSDLSQGPAMTTDQALAAIDAGRRTAHDLIDAGHRLLVTGDLGIGNTTPSAALVAVFTDSDAADVTGRGAGSDDAMLQRKIEVVRAGIRHNGASIERPLEALAAVGGYEHAALTGFLLTAASRRTPVVLDGVIACSSALVARALCRHVTAYLIAGHRSEESGASVAMEALGLIPLIDHRLRLGEGSGAALAVPAVQAAARILREVATFETAGVSESS